MNGVWKFPDSWSPDGRFLSYTQSEPGRPRDIWILPTTGGARPFPIAQTPAEESGGGVLAGRALSRLRVRRVRPVRGLREDLPRGDEEVAGLHRRRRLAGLAHRRERALLPDPGSHPGCRSDRPRRGRPRARDPAAPVPERGPAPAHHRGGRPYEATADGSGSSPSSPWARRIRRRSCCRREPDRDRAPARGRNGARRRPGSALPGGGRRGQGGLALVARPPRQRGEPRRRSAAALERAGERPLQGADRGRRTRHADRAGATGSTCSGPALDGADPGARPAPGPSGTPLARQRFLVTAYDRNDGSVAWKRVAVERVPHEGHHGDEHLRLGLAHDRRGARLRPLRLAGVSSATTRRARRSGRRRTSGRCAPGTPTAREARRRSTARPSSSRGTTRGILVPVRPRQAHGPGPEAEGPTRRGELLVDARHPGARGAGAGDRRRREPHPGLRHPRRARSCGGLGLGRRDPHPVPRGGDPRLGHRERDYPRILAVDLRGAHGDLNGTKAVVWSRDRDTPDVSTPLLYRGRLYFFKTSRAS